MGRWLFRSSSAIDHLCMYVAARDDSLDVPITMRQHVSPWAVGYYPVTYAFSSSSLSEVTRRTVPIVIVSVTRAATLRANCAREMVCTEPVNLPSWFALGT